MRKFAFLAGTVILLLFLSLLIACSGGSSSQQNLKANVNVTLSDPPTCGAAQGGAYDHIYVTVRDVKIHTNPDAGPNDSGWIDLTPTLSAGAPVQIDLLGVAASKCFLQELGSQTELQPGTYQQIRVLLADNGTAPSNGNACGNGSFNCIVPTGATTPVPLQLSSEATTGIKIPSGQIAGGRFTIAQGQTKDLNIDFNACASIVHQGGQYRLKPVLHAGEVSLTSESINGTVVDNATNQPVAGKVVVALEQKDDSGVEHAVMQTSANSLGQWAFCPVPAGTYDVVVVAVSDSGVAYGPTILTGVQPGNTTGAIPLYAASGVSTAPGTIKGTVTSSTGSAPIGIDVVLDVLQQVTLNGSSSNVLIPLAPQSDTTLRVVTAAGGQCASNTACADYSLVVPASNPAVGAFSASGTTYTAPASAPVAYTVEAAAFVSSSNQTPNCTQPVLTTDKQLDGTTALTVAPGGTVTAKTLDFTGCQ